MNSQSNPALVASIDGMVTPLSEQECVFHAREGGRSHVMTLDVLRAMDLCRSFRTMDEHVQVIAGQIQGLAGQEQAIGQVLQFLVDRRLMRGADEAVAYLAEDGDRVDAVGNTGVIIGGSASRLSDLLARLGEQPFGEIEWLVLDSARSPKAIEANAKVVAEAAGEGLVVRHLDLQWRRRLAAHLAALLDLDGELLESGLAGSGHGSLWNCAQLLAAGGQLLHLNECDRPLFRARAGAKDQWDLRLRGGDLPLTLIRDDGVFDQALQPAMRDVAADMNDLCGARLISALKTSGVREEQLKGLSWKEVEALKQARLGALVPGSWGDVREISSDWIFQLPPAALPSVAPTREAYYDWLRHPLRAEGSDGYRLAQVAERSPVAMDGRRLPAPAPIGAEESEFGFGAWQRYCHADALTVHLPWMMEFRSHAEQPPLSETPLPGLGRLLGEFALYRMADCAADGAAQRMGTLSAIVDDLAHASDERLSEIVGEFLTNHRAERVRRIQTAVNAIAAPPGHWKADATSWMKHDAEVLAEEVAPRLRDHDPLLTADACLESIRSSLQQQARWLRLWPQLWTAACKPQAPLTEL